MSAPEPMACLASECPSPLSCNHRGECSARREDSARSYDEAIRSCRETGRIPQSWKRGDNRHG